jgi:archaemetzincin
MSLVRVAALEPLAEAVLVPVEEALRAGFGVAVERCGALGRPDYAWDEARAQYNAPLILKRMLDTAARDPSKLLAVTARDLYIPMLSFVYGLAQLGGRVAVISLERLRTEHYGLDPDEALLAVRAKKEALHEVGHLFGLVHCPDTRCAMALATGIRQLDMKQPSLCAGCAALASERHGD